jgi:hypothetical protein
MLYEVRSREDQEAPINVDELARRYRLDPMIIYRLLEAEGMVVEVTSEFEPIDGGTDERRVTAVFDPEVLAAARKRAAGEDADD